MTNQQQMMQSISESFGGKLAADEVALLAVLGTIFISYIVYGLWFQLKQTKRSTFESLH